MINTRTSKRIKRLRLLGMFFIMIFIIKMIPGIKTFVLANNSYNTLYEYSYDTDECEITDLMTEYRPKTDTTSAYIYNAHSTTPIEYIRIMGRNYGESYGVDCTYRVPLSCDLGEEVYLPNYVGERKYQLASLLFSPCDGHHAYIGFLWSPDSV